MATRTEKLKNKPGIYRYHRRDCARVVRDKRCNCDPGYQATVFNKRDQSRIRKHFDRLAEAEGWRNDVIAAMNNGGFVAPVKVTVAAALDELTTGMESGAIRNRSGKIYKPSAVRTYTRSAGRLKKEIGHMQLRDVQLMDMDALVGRLRTEGRSASSIRNVIDPLRVVYRMAIRRGMVSYNPTHLLEITSGDEERTERRTVSPKTAEMMIDALPASERALWAVAIYVGLRRGELQALRWSDLDMDENIGYCRGSWDSDSREFINTKSAAGQRMFPITELVRFRLDAHQLATGRSGDDLVFGRTAFDPFTPTTIRRRALKAWGWKEIKNPEDEGPRMIWVKARDDAFEPITLHEGRHSAATAGGVSGVDDKRLSHMMGHSSIVVTKDIYGHVREDQIKDLTEHLNAYYEAAIG